MVKKLIDFITKRSKISELSNKVEFLTDANIKLQNESDQYRIGFFEMTNELNKYKVKLDKSKKELSYNESKNNALKKKVDALTDINASYVKTFSNTIQYDNEIVEIKDENFKDLSQDERTILHYQKIIERVSHISMEMSDGPDKKYDKFCEYQYMLDTLSDPDNTIFDTQPGYVYIIKNKSFGGNIHKVGLTRNINVECRMKTLNNTSIPFPFEICAVIFSPDVVTAEREIHEVLNQYLLNKEFFDVDFKTIIKLIKKYDDSLFICDKDFTKFF